MVAVIELSGVTFAYDTDAAPVLSGVSLRIPEGELCLVVGGTGSGKSTLLRLLNGLAPHFTGGHLAGSVIVDGLDTRTHAPRDMARVVGFVGQNPVEGFVTDRVEDELAYSMEQFGIAHAVMRQRVEHTIDLLALHGVRNRSLSTLSAGEQQRVAIGAALTAGPSVLVLDEPTSALDPLAAEEVLAALLRLVHDLGVTVVLAEHRLERVIQYADSLLYLDGEGSVAMGPPGEVLAERRIVPPLVELGRFAGWNPLPLSIRDARRVAGPLRERLTSHTTAEHTAPDQTAVDSAPRPAGDVVLRAEDLSVQYGSRRAVSDVSLILRAGEVTALMGRNGSGKSSLLWALQGSGPRSAGEVRLATTADAALDPAALSAEEAIRHIVLVPDNPTDLVYLESVEAECSEADASLALPPGTTSALVQRLWPGLPSAQHPRDLSEGQRLALVLGLQLAGTPRVVLLDEPTRGLDYAAKQRLGEVLGGLAASGASVLFSSHDVEFVA
ncbi:MAG TPA: ATP-binding cassette domain-containing protein, partial [Terrimesophilobacter sp.]|nr:ATP-binding cassette domain-containing protein [Terrimesophilobacter sp.]